MATAGTIQFERLAYRWRWKCIFRRTGHETQVVETFKYTLGPYAITLNKEFGKLILSNCDKPCRIRAMHGKGTVTDMQAYRCRRKCIFRRMGHETQAVETFKYTLGPYAITSKNECGKHTLWNCYKSFRIRAMHGKGTVTDMQYIASRL